MSFLTPVSAQPPPAPCNVVNKIRKTFSREREGWGVGGIILPKLGYICVRERVNYTLIVLRRGLCLPVGYVFYILSRCILHSLREEKGLGLGRGGGWVGGGGAVIEGLRVGVLYELRSRLPLVTSHLCTNRREGKGARMRAPW